MVFGATSVLAAELPISGVYGDELGCARIIPGHVPDEPGGINVFPSEIEGYEWGCTFAEIWPYPNDFGHAVQGICIGEGTPFLEQYIITLSPVDPTFMTVFSTSGDVRWQLNLCESNRGEGGKG